MPEEEATCEGCGNPIDKCTCECPYCGETENCECCIDQDAVTGG